METTAAIFPPGWNTDVDGYELLRELSPGKSALAVASGNRSVVLKVLDSDCLTHSGSQPKLHPTIRDRLARVRELAHGRVANLHGVEAIQGRVCLVWEYCPGETLEEWAMGEEVSSKDLMLAARELILTVESLHVRGIVHGAIHGRNAIVDPQGNLKLTHVSPLLYSDPQVDLASVAELFSGLARRRGETNSPLDQLASEAQESDATLRSMGARAATLIDLKKDEASDDVERLADLARRRRSKWAAGAVVLAAILFFYGIQQYTRYLVPKLSTPPDAMPEAMR